VTIEIIHVPDLGGAETVEVIELSVAPGDTVELDQPLLMVESDKATMDIPSPVAGIVKSLLVNEGDSVGEGAAIVELEISPPESGSTSSVNASDSTQTEATVAPVSPAIEDSASEENSSEESSPEDSTPEDSAPEDSASPAASSEQTFQLPDVGAEEAVEVIEVSVASGDTVEEGDTLFVLETDKATMDVPAPSTGSVVNLLVSEGDMIKQGDDIVVIMAAVVATAVKEPEAPVTPVEEQPPADATEAIVTPSDTPAEKTIELPDIGTEEAVDVVEISVSVGDTVEEGDTLLVLETDKATMDIPAPDSGDVVKLLVAEGDKVQKGEQIAVLLTAASASVASVSGKVIPSATSATPVAEVSQPATASSAVAVPTSGADVYAGPATRQSARELGVDLKRVKGSGPRGRILKEDLHEYLKSAVAKAESGTSQTTSGTGIPQVPDIDYSKFGDTEVIPLNKIQKLTAANMQRSWLNVPHVTQFDAADISELEEFRQSLKPEAERRGSKLTPMPFLLKACAHALKENPMFLRAITSDGESFIQKKYINIGMAVDTPRGLVVPVVRDVDKKGIWEIASDVNSLAAKARDGKLTAADMQGGCFTISSLGAIGGSGFTPIVNTPEVGILAVSKSEMKPVWDGSEFVPRLMLPLALSYDHRVINGGDCGRFFTYLVSQIADLRRLAL